jgi:excisionase family DNA binding protein
MTNNATLAPGDKPIAVSVSRAALLIDVSKATIRTYVRAGRLKGARMGRRVLIPMNSLEQLVRESMISHP